MGRELPAGHDPLQGGAEEGASGNERRGAARHEDEEAEGEKEEEDEKNKYNDEGEDEENRDEDDDEEKDDKNGDEDEKNGDEEEDEGEAVVSSVFCLLTSDLVFFVENYFFV